MLNTLIQRVSKSTASYSLLGTVELTISSYCTVSKIYNKQLLMAFPTLILNLIHANIKFVVVKIWAHILCFLTGCNNQVVCFYLSAIFYNPNHSRKLKN